jgi:hypothetical protein
MLEDLTENISLSLMPPSPRNIIDAAIPELLKRTGSCIQWNNCSGGILFL